MKILSCTDSRVLSSWGSLHQFVNSHSSRVGRCGQGLAHSQHREPLDGRSNSMDCNSSYVGIGLEVHAIHLKKRLKIVLQDLMEDDEEGILRR